MATRRELLTNGLLAAAVVLVFQVLGAVFAWTAMHRGDAFDWIIMGVVAPQYVVEVFTGRTLQGGTASYVAVQFVYCLGLVYLVRYGVRAVVRWGSGGVL